MLLSLVAESRIADDFDPLGFDQPFVLACPEMSSHVALRGEAAAAEWTAEGPFTGVGACVILESTLRREASSAVLTDVWPVLSVGTLMDATCLLLAEPEDVAEKERGRQG